MAKPILKWAGGKTVILDAIEKKIDQIESKDSTFYDVFAGGISVSLRLHNKFKSVVINDKNEEIINVYQVVKNNYKKLIELLEVHKLNHSKAYFYKIREMDRDSSYDELNKIQKAARTIYLNKTCYNGLYRVNSKGQFNVPIGRQTKLSIYDKENIQSLSDVLKKFKIRNEDFSVVLKECKAGDVVYIDPPYDKLNKNSFIEYNEKKFDWYDQRRLKTEIDILTKRGVYVIASNSYTERIATLYKNYITEESIIKVKRSIGANERSREPVEEILIDNFDKVRKNTNKGKKNNWVDKTI